MDKVFKNVWFRCISVLLAIALISGGLLAILNDVLYVSPIERTGRAIAKIYGQPVEITDGNLSIKIDGKTVDISEENIIIDVDSTVENKKEPVKYAFGQINKLYKLNNDMLFQTTGYQGYKNGTVTLWVKVVNENSRYDIQTVILQSNEKQTLMSKFTGAYFDNFKLTDITKEYSEDKLFTVAGSENVNQNTGATYSATACCNAVNCVLSYLGGNV